MALYVSVLYPDVLNNDCKSLNIDVYDCSHNASLHNDSPKSGCYAMNL